MSGSTARPRFIGGSLVPFELLVVGASLGGGHALEVLLAGLPGDFPLPVVIVQHRLAEGTSDLVAQLQMHSRLPVREAEDKDAIMPSQVYLAPADYHLLMEDSYLALSTEAPTLSARPSIDALFVSAGERYGERLIGAILTGASEDGAQGAARIKELGGFVIVQDPATAEGSVMPKAAIAAASVDKILPLEEIAPFLAALVAVKKE